MASRAGIFAVAARPRSAPGASPVTRAWRPRAGADRGRDEQDSRRQLGSRGLGRGDPGLGARAQGRVQVVMNPCKYEIPSGSTYGFLIADDAAQACRRARVQWRMRPIWRACVYMNIYIYIYKERYFEIQIE